MAGRPKSDETKREITKSPARMDRKSPSRIPGPAGDTPKKSPVRTPRPKSPGRGGSAKKSPGRPRSPGRARSPGRPKNSERPKSPGRPKTPSRQKRTKSKSPIRISPIRKSPSRQSPARAVKESKTVVRDIFVKTEKYDNKASKIQQLDLDSDSDVGDTFESKIEKPKATVRGRTRRLDIDNYEKEIEDVKELTNTYKDISATLPTVTRRITRSTADERVVHLKNYDAFTKLSEFSDDDEVIQTKLVDSLITPKKETKSKLNIWNKVGSLSAVVFTPLIYVGLHMLCNEEHCSFTKLPNMAKYKKVSTFFDLFSFLLVIGYTLIVAILSAIPYGGKRVSSVASKIGKMDYVMNGGVSALLMSLTVLGLHYLGIPVSHYIRTHFLQLCVASALVSLVFSIYLYIRSFYVSVSHLNPNAVTEDKLYNFVVGRETNPRLFGVLDLKLFFFRFACIGILIINTCLLLDSLEVKNPSVSLTEPLAVIKSLKVNPTFLTIAMIQSLYIWDAFIFEHTFVTTFENQYEGLGYIFCIQYGVGAFVYTYLPKYVLDYDVQLTSLQLALTILPFIAGYVLVRLSMWQKDTFRQNPYHPRVARLDSIPTGQGKKLLISGLWGFVRHPNYLGDILIYTSWVPFALCYPPVLIPYLSILYLIHRSVRDGRRCKEHYGPSWDRYCQKVKYVLIPKIY